MPLPSDPATVENGKALLETLRGIFGKHPGQRPAHAKGILLSGTFTPTAEAAKLSKAPHFTAPSTPVTARFSSSTGIPVLPDNDPNGNPRGFALRFNLPNSAPSEGFPQGKRQHTDIIAHSTPSFPARDGPSALAFFQAAGTGKIGEYLPSHPEALAFVTTPKPFPAEFWTITYFGVHAFVLVDAEGKRTTVRYRFVPSAGKDETLSDDEGKARAPTYLFDGVKERFAGGAGAPVELKLLAQLAAEGDVANDATVLWPEDREVVTLGTVKLDAVVPEAEQESGNKRIVYDPVPRVDGVEASDDPLIDVRAAIYLISGQDRRAA